MNNIHYSNLNNLYVPKRGKTGRRCTELIIYIIYLKGFFTCNSVGLCYPLSTKQSKAQGGAKDYEKH